MLRDFVAYQLALDFYRRCKRVKVPRFLQDQLLRASSSVVLNLAEGSGKRTAAEQAHFYGNALGSFRECEAILEMERVVLEEETREMMRRLGSILFRLSKRDLTTEKRNPKPTDSEP